MENFIHEYIYFIITLLISSNIVIFIFFNMMYKTSVWEVQKEQKKEYEYLIKDYNRQRLENKIRCLETYKREICSNRLLPRKDLIEYEENLLEFKNHINQISESEFMKLVVEMDEKYKFIYDFDFFGMKSFVDIREYREKINHEYGHEEFKENYLDLGKEIILIDKFCDYNDVFNVKMEDIKIDLMKETFGKEERKEFYVRLKKGFDHYSKNLDWDKDENLHFEDEIVKVDIHPEWSPGTEKQVTLKKTNEYGIVEYFSEGDKSWTTYYRTDEDFKNRQHLGIESERWDENKIEEEEEEEES